MTKKPELSIIVPALNEAGEIEELLATLTAQERVAAEVIVVDGGSTDGTAEIVRCRADALPFPVILLDSERGRARQLNSGARAARGDFLLFLHADSRFEDPLALRTGIDELCKAGSGNGGRFSLRFRRTGDGGSLAYFFYERKARLDRPECTHGDQGLLLPRELFRSLGTFDEEAPVAPETRFADRLRERGARWLLLSPEIVTSARRFATEGFRERQTLNAVIMNLAAAGRDDFIALLPEVYASQDASRKLDLRPFLARIERLIREIPAEEQTSFWRASTRHFRSHAWQIPFFLDVVRHTRRHGFGGDVRTPLLRGYDRFLGKHIDILPLRIVSRFVLEGWLRLSAGVSARRRG
jgi:rSAM/selenodomain-associated transferase 2